MISSKQYSVKLNILVGTHQPQLKLSTSMLQHFMQPLPLPQPLPWCTGMQTVVNPQHSPLRPMWTGPTCGHLNFKWLQRTAGGDSTARGVYGLHVLSRSSFKDTSRGLGSNRGVWFCSRCTFEWSLKDILLPLIFYNLFLSWVEARYLWHHHGRIHRQDAASYSQQPGVPAHGQRGGQEGLPHGGHGLLLHHVLHSGKRTLTLMDGAKSWSKRFLFWFGWRSFTLALVKILF